MPTYGQINLLELFTVLLNAFTDDKFIMLAKQKRKSRKKVEAGRKGGRKAARNRKIRKTARGIARTITRTADSFTR